MTRGVSRTRQCKRCLGWLCILQDSVKDEISFMAKSGSARAKEVVVSGMDRTKGRGGQQALGSRGPVAPSIRDRIQGVGCTVSFDSITLAYCL